MVTIPRLIGFHRSRDSSIGPVAAIVFVSSLLPTGASAEVSPFAAASITYDDNLFRFSDDTDSAAVLGTNARSDTYYRLEAGVVADISSGRQYYQLDARLNRNLYDRFSFLDYTGGEIRARGELELSEVWGADFDVGYNRELASFAYQVLPTRNLKSTFRASGNATRYLDPRWSVHFGAFFRDFSFSERELNDREETGAIVGVDYRSRADNRLGFQLTVTDGKFPNRNPDSVTGIDDGYLRTDVESLLNWMPTGKSTITATLGYAWVDSNNFSSRDFDGPTGRLRYRWTPTGKFMLITVVRRDISDINGELTNFAKISALDLLPRWQLTGRTTLVGLIGYQKRDFENVTDLAVVDTDERKDTVQTYSLGIEYEVTRRSTLDLNVTHEIRDSNEPFFDYDDTTVFANLTLVF